VEKVHGMPATRQELDSFHRFALEKLPDSGAETSLEELLAIWRQDREYSETIEDVHQGLNDYDAGRCQSLADAFQAVRADLGLTK
jgi:hypothetical protein